MDGLLRLYFESQTLLADHAVTNADVGLDIAGVAGVFLNFFCAALP